MLDGFRGLVDLSKLDTDLAAQESEMGQLPARREDCVARKAAAQARLDEARAVLSEAEQEQRRRETDAQDQEALLTRLEGQQHQVKTNEAYTALLHEMDAARDAISQAETHILEAMERIEASQAELAAGEAEVKALETAIAEEERAIDEREKELEGLIARLNNRRGELVAELDASLLSLYERIRSRRIPAVAIVSKEICLGCRVGIPPQTSIELLRAEAIITCGHCQRILVLEDRLRG